MMKSFRQIVILCFVILAVLAGCATVADKQYKEVSPYWFKLRKSIRLMVGEDKIQPHLFYDAAPELDSTTGRVYVLPVAVANQDRAYEIDPLSGQRFFSHFWCGQVDAWKKRGSTPRRPTFTRAVVPRHFDQLHEPQQIIVFGNTNHYDIKQPHVYPVRIVGGLVEQVCPMGRCSGPNEWLARLVLVAVNDSDSNFANVKTIRQLQKEVNWRDVQNQLENHEGHNLTGAQITPAIKVGNLLESKEVLDYSKERSVVLTQDELAKVNKQCGILYLKLWKEVGAFATADTDPNMTLQQRVQLREDQKKLGKATSFRQRLTYFLREEGDALATCSRLVYPGNPNGNYQRFWFTSWITQFARLHREGWRYSCSNNNWVSVNEGKAAMEYLRKESGTCSDRGFDLAMKTMGSFLKAQRSVSGERWAFLDWDNSPYGTHSKLYSWIKVPGRQMSCPDSNTEKVRGRWGEQPDGPSWPERQSGPGQRGEDDYIF